MTQNFDAAFTAFANTIYDVTDLSRLLDEINLIERSLFKDKTGTIYEKAKDYLSTKVLNVFLQIEETGLEPDGDQKQLQFLKDLVNFLHNLPLVKATVAFEPNKTFVMKLNNQISAILAKKVILNLIIDESVIGGAIFEYRGKTSEQTLKKKLDDMLVNLVEKEYATSSQIN